MAEEKKGLFGALKDKLNEAKEKAEEQSAAAAAKLEQKADNVKAEAKESAADAKIDFATAAASIASIKDVANAAVKEEKAEAAKAMADLKAKARAEALEKAAQAKAEAEEAAKVAEAEAKAAEEKLSDATIEKLAKEVIRGDWGNGDERKQKLTAAGYDYAKVQGKVNEMLGAAPKKAADKSVEQLAKEVIQGKWGNGDERKKKLTAAGYDYSAVQKKVNEMLG
ncbi:MAG: hypothetical protein IJH91_01685 [Mogibacterium sp.]|nr:hypothetical protein [Mogibacterium sp.]